MKRKLFLGLLFFGSLFAANPTLNVQGVLRDASGMAVIDGNYDLNFFVYAAATGGTAIWNENHSSVQIRNGVYSVQLGEVSSLAGLTFTQPYYVSVAVNGGSEALPRIPLSVSPSALSVTGTSNIFPNDGNVGIGTTTPSQKLTVEGNIQVNGNIHGQAYSGVGTVLGIGNDSRLEDINVQNTAGIYGAQNEAEGGLLLGSGGAKLYGKGGKLGINTTDPAAQLHVGGTVSDVAVNGGGTLVVGNPGGVNLAMDDNEIMARNNGQVSTLHLNADGGTTNVGGSLTIASQLPMYIEDYNLGSGRIVDYNTNVSTANYIAMVVGVDAGGYDIAEDGAHWGWQVVTHPVDNQWHIRARMNSHGGDTPDWIVHVLFIRRELAQDNRDEWWHGE